MILGLSGYAQSGKDTAAEVLYSHFEFKKRAFADALRACLYALNPIVNHQVNEVHEFGTKEPVTVLVDPIRYRDLVDSQGYEYAKKLPEVRELLQRLGTQVGREILGDNIWVEAALQEIDETKDYVFTDMRFPNEYQAVKDSGGICVRIVRPGFTAINDHPSETSLDGYQFDHILDNDGTIEDFQSKIIDWVNTQSRDMYVAAALDVLSRG